MNNWITPDFINNGQNRNQKRKVSDCKTHVIKHNLQDIWTKKYCPKKLLDVIVNKKKLFELQSWLENALASKTTKVLILSGPSGCGKRESIKCIAHELSLEVCEWINPISLYDVPLDNSNKIYNPQDQVVADSQSQKFKDFFLRGSRYPSLCSVGFTRKNILIIDDIPNVCVTNPTVLHDILRNYKKIGSYPVVFVMSDVTSGPRSILNLFPADIYKEIGIAHIRLNPIPPTSMFKLLNNIAKKEAINISKEDLDSVVAISNGDMRNAINSLQFSCMKSGRDTPKAEGGKAKNTRSRKNKPSEGSQVFGDKDKVLFLFRAIGRVLYCKRGEDPSSVESLPSHLSKMEKKPLLYDPQELVDKCPLSGSNFVLFLHQSYLNFFSGCSDIEEASAYLSDCDLIMSDWSNHHYLEEAGSLVAVRGLFFSNNNQPSGRTWSAFHKPKWYSISKTISERSHLCQFASRRLNCTYEDAVLDVIPYLSKLPGKSTDPNLLSIIDDIGNMSAASKNRFYSEAISEEDAVLDMDEEEANNINMIVDDEPVIENNFSDDEEYSIEEYED